MWLVDVAAGVACAVYLNVRALIVPRWGVWYPDPSGQPYVLLQVRAFLAGRLALVTHPEAAGHDELWGRGGMHSAWGLGVPILATPFTVVARLFGAPGFPDPLLFLIFYGAVTALLAGALRRLAPKESRAPVAAAAAAGFVMTFPAFVGLVEARFLIYDETIAFGVVWAVLLLAALLSLLVCCTAGRFTLVCAAAAFAPMIRATLAIYGVTTVAIAVVVAWRRGLRGRGLVGGAFAGLAVTALYLAGNELRFGSAFEAGYANVLAGPIIGRLARWGLPFAEVPFATAAKELFITLFFLNRISTPITRGMPPEAVRPYAVAERWREYYSPTYDLFVLCLWCAAVVLLASRALRPRARSKTGGDLRREAAAVIGTWALPPSVVLFVFYARVGALVTRYLVDLYPAFAAAALCVGMAAVEAVRRRAPARTVQVRRAVAAAGALYVLGWHGWPHDLSHATDARTVTKEIADIEARSKPMPDPPDHFQCGEPRGRQPVHTHLQDWHEDCSFTSGVVFAMVRSPCVALTFAPKGARWGASEDESLRGLRATADFDHLVSCGAPRVDGETRRVTMCEPRPPTFLLDGMRLYSIATLDTHLEPIDRLKLMKVDPTAACP